LQDIQGGLADFNRAIQFDSSDAYSYKNRALVKYDLNDRSGGIADMEKAAKLFQQQGNQKDAGEVKSVIKKWQKAKNTSPII
jgi:regulator of sirC expression with transglutaminase-like and TPR domain